jgi:hypothetical protein
MPNFVHLDLTQPDVARLVTAMVQARGAVESRSWSHPQEPTTEEWWADVLADPRARTTKRRSDYTTKQAFYRLADEPQDTILVACSKCDWKAAARRADRRTRGLLPDAEPAGTPRRSGLSTARITMGSLRRPLCRANRSVMRARLHSR